MLHQTPCALSVSAAQICTWKPTSLVAADSYPIQTTGGLSIWTDWRVQNDRTYLTQKYVSTAMPRINYQYIHIKQYFIDSRHLWEISIYKVVYIHFWLYRYVSSTCESIIGIKWVIYLMFSISIHFTMACLAWQW